MAALSSMKDGDDSWCSLEIGSGRRFSGRPTLAVLRVLDWLAERMLPPDKGPAHQRTGAGARKPLTSTLENWAIRWWRETSDPRVAEARLI